MSPPGAVLWRRGKEVHWETGFPRDDLYAGMDT